MKTPGNNHKRIVFFSSLPYEIGGGAEIITLQTAHALSMKKNYSARLLSYKRNPTEETLNPLLRLWELFLYRSKVIHDKNRLTREDIQAILGKAEYKKFSFLRIIKELKTADYIFVRSDMPSLIPVFF